MKRILIWSALGLALVAGTAWAGSDERIGTAGAAELRIPVGTRTAALGGAAIADVQGAEAIFWNPAGIALSEHNEAFFSHMRYLGDMKLNYASVLLRTDDAGTLGFSAKVLSVGDILVTTEEQPEGTGQVTSPTFTVLGVSYARQMTDRVTFGGSINLVNESILQETSNGIAFDLGFQYALNWHGVRIAGVLKNWGPQMHYSGADLEGFFIPPGSRPDANPRSYQSISGDFEMPAQAQIAIAGNLWNLEGNRVTGSASFQSNNFSRDQFQGGVEYGYKNTLFLRGGYTFSQKDDAKGIGYLYGFTGGLGISWPIGDQHVDVGYSFQQVKEFFDHNHTFSLRYLF